METMFMTSLMLNIAGIQNVYLGMGTPLNKDVLAQMGFASAMIDAAQPNDLIYAAQADTEAVFAQAITRTSAADCTARFRPHTDPDTSIRRQFQPASPISAITTAVFFSLSLVLAGMRFSSAFISAFQAARRWRMVSSSPGMIFV